MREIDNNNLSCFKKMVKKIIKKIKERKITADEIQWHIGATNVFSSTLILLNDKISSLSFEP